MSDDVTLSSFGGEESTDADDDESPAPPEPIDSATDPAEAAASPQPESPSLTYTSSPDGDTCAACGDTVTTRWRAGEGADDPDALVCPDCKDW